MAKAKVIHSKDAVQINFLGDIRNPEPSTGVIKFPGGHVEVSRCSDGSYWAHIEVVDPVNIINSRVDYSNAYQHNIKAVQDFPHGDHVKHVAINVSNAIPHFDPDA
jgi:hypothetical protein